LLLGRLTRGVSLSVWHLPASRQVTVEWPTKPTTISRTQYGALVAEIKRQP
jgi:hypothetical protein